MRTSVDDEVSVRHEQAENRKSNNLAIMKTRDMLSDF